jgi:type VI secretion system secreted protein VgrG
VVARLRTDSERGQDRRCEAVGDVAELGAGLRVTLGGETVPGLGEEFICLSATHSYVSDSYGSGAQDSDEYSYSGRYILLPVTAPLLPERKTARADVKGPQTAVVVGEGEIDCDEYGRILVRFHWDLAKANSMRCRVSQNWAGNGWGGMVIPRIGMEVLVEFLDGDPDQPLVTGCVYNGRNKVPYPLPANKTKSVFRSDSHQSDGFNELTFEDATGAENISFHAQKDMTLKVLNNHAKRVDNDDVESVGNNKSIEVGNNFQVKFGGSYNQSVGSASNGALFSALGGLLGGAASKMAEGASEVGNPAVTSFVGGLAASSVAAEAVSLGGNANFNGAGQHRKVAGLAQTGAASALGTLLSTIMPITGVMNSIVEKAKSETVGLVSTEQVGLFKNTMVGVVQTNFVGKKAVLDVGEESIVKVGKTRLVEVGEELTVKVGKSMLVMKADGTIRLLGDNLNITMSGPVQINGSVIDLN